MEEPSAEARSQMYAIAVEYQKLLLDLNDDLAIKVINRLGEALK